MIVIQITYWCIVLCALVLQSTKDSTISIFITDILNRVMCHWCTQSYYNLVVKESHYIHKDAVNVIPSSHHIYLGY